jgi:hypothetical protein
MAAPADTPTSGLANQLGPAHLQADLDDAVDAFTAGERHTRRPVRDRLLAAREPDGYPDRVGCRFRWGGVPGLERWVVEWCVQGCGSRRWPARGWNGK